MESEQSNENEDELLVTAAASAVVTIAASTVIQKRRRRVGLAAVAAASSSRQACSAIPKTASAGVGSNNHGKHLVWNPRASLTMRAPGWSKRWGAELFHEMFQAHLHYCERASSALKQPWNNAETNQVVISCICTDPKIKHETFSVFQLLFHESFTNVRTALGVVTNPCLAVGTTCQSTQGRHNLLGTQARA